MAGRRVDALKRQRETEQKNAGANESTRNEKVPPAQKLGGRNMPRMEVMAAVAVAFVLAYLWMRWDEHRELRNKGVQRNADAAVADRHRR